MPDYPEPVLLRRFALGIDDYHHLGEGGVFAPDARVELIEGEIIDMAPIGSRHAGMVRDLMQRLFEAAGRHAVVSCQDPIRLDNNTKRSRIFAC